MNGKQKHTGLDKGRKWTRLDLRPVKVLDTTAKECGGE